MITYILCVAITLHAISMHDMHNGKTFYTLMIGTVHACYVSTSRQAISHNFHLVDSAD